MTKTLTLATGNLDRINTFNVVVRGRLDTNTMKCQLRHNYQKSDDGIYWALSVGGVLQGIYDNGDIEERARLLQEEPVKNGDLVLINGKEYRAKVLGAYSDACIFEEA